MKTTAKVTNGSIVRYPWDGEMAQGRITDVFPEHVHVTNPEFVEVAVARVDLYEPHLFAFGDDIPLCEQD